MNKFEVINESFRISSHLKDILGQELVTQKFVAIFELVKNSIDARATVISIEFDTNENCIYIVDNGKGMTRDDIINKWLFVAYSAKSDGSEDDGVNDYRDSINKSQAYAGRKGIGRFSCDALGEELTLYSKSIKNNSYVSRFSLDWREFEGDSKKLFSDIEVKIENTENFPNLDISEIPKESGTILKIGSLRENWNDNEVIELRKYLAKLIDPFGVAKKIVINTFVFDSEIDNHDLNGPIGNNITDLLEEKTSRIHVTFERGTIVTELYDRGTRIFRVSEDNNYELLYDMEISANIYYLNRSAKLVFKNRMGVSSVKFGNIFLFLNGFRIFPIGEENVDTFGLDYRKYQGHSRYLGTRDVLGKVEVFAPVGKFREVSSRDAGLIKDANTNQLYSAIFEKALLPLERYVVGVTWPDRDDQDRDTFSGFEDDEAKNRILNVLGRIAKDTKINFLEYDKRIVDFTDEKQIDSESALNDLLVIAERENNKSLIRRLKNTKDKIKNLEKTQKEVKMLKNVIKEKDSEYNHKIGALEKQTEFLKSGQNLDANSAKLLIHQISIYAKNILSEAETGFEYSKESQDTLSECSQSQQNELKGLIYGLNHPIDEVINSFSKIKLESDRILNVIKLTTLVKTNIKSHKIVDNIILFLNNYILYLSNDTSFGIQIHFDTDISNFVCEYSPFDVIVMVDNLIDNSKKAKADNIWFEAKKDAMNKHLRIIVHDDGTGLDSHKVDPSKIFDMHYSGTASGTGLGLYHVSEVLKEIEGTIELVQQQPDQLRADFAITIPEKRK